MTKRKYRIILEGYSNKYVAQEYVTFGGPYGYITISDIEASSRYTKVYSDLVDYYHARVRNKVKGVGLVVWEGDDL